MKRCTLAVVVALALAVLGLTGCSLFEDRFAPPLEGPTGATAVVGHESVVISWTPMAGATSYAVHYTDDGSTPSGDSGLVGSTQSASMTHEDASADKAYSYAIIATLDGRTTLPTTTPGVTPEPKLRITATFESYTDAPAGALLVEYDSEGVSRGIMAGSCVTTTADGTATFEFDIFRGRYWGYTVFKDADRSATISSGDRVWGSSSTSPSSLWFSSATTESRTTTLAWDTRFATSTTYSGDPIGP
jgi:hypothetical protein